MAMNFPMDRRALAMDPRYAGRLDLARALMSGGTDGQPVRSIGEGIAKMGQAALGGYFAGQVGKEMEGRRKAEADTLAKALSAGMGSPAGLDPSSGITWNTAREGDPQMMAQILAGNPDTAPIGMQMALGDIESQRTLDRTLAVERAKQAGEPPKTREVKRDGKIVTEQWNPTTRTFEQIAEAPQFKPEGQPGGPFAGNALDAQALNIVATYEQRRAAGEPTTPQDDYVYSLAKRQLEQARVVGTPESGFTQITPPPLPAYPGAQPAAPPAVATAPQAPAAPSPAPAGPGTPVAAAPAPGQSGVTPLTPRPQSAAERAKAQENEQKFNRIGRTVDAYESLLKEVGPTKSFGPLTGPVGTKLQTAYTDMLLEMKELANLGVLNGPDYMLMTQMLVDPTSVQAQRIGTTGLLEQTALVRKKLEAAKADAARIYSGPQATQTAEQTPVDKKWIIKDGQLVPES